MRRLLMYLRQRWPHCLYGGIMAKTKVSFGVSEEELEYWKRVSWEKGYTNFSKFIRDVINEYISNETIEKEYKNSKIKIL